jgi:hypothetical protein
MKIKHVKILAFFVFFLGIPCLKAQEALTTTGGDAYGGVITISYSVGQVAYITARNLSYGSVNQGVEQPYDNAIPDGENDHKNISLELSVYPNPTISRVILKVNNQNLENFSFKLYDSNGKLLLAQKVRNKITPIFMDNLPTATYILNVFDKKTEIKIFKIIKNS